MPNQRPKELTERWLLLGEGEDEKQSGCWELSHPAFEPLRAFVAQLVDG